MRNRSRPTTQRTQLHQAIRSPPPRPFRIIPGSAECALCRILHKAHHLRELDGVAEVAAQKWATDMVALLANTWHRVLELKEAGTTSMDDIELARLRSAYDAIIAAGHVANPPPPPSGRRGRPAKTKAANLLGRLDLYSDDVLRFATDFRVGFDNYPDVAVMPMFT